MREEKHRHKFSVLAFLIIMTDHQKLKDDRLAALQAAAKQIDLEDSQVFYKISLLSSM